MSLDAAGLYADMAPKLRSYFIARLPAYDRDLADDFVGDTFVRVLAALPRYQDRGRASSWVYQIAHNLLRDHFRHLACVEPMLPFDLQQHDGADPHAERAYDHVRVRLTLAPLLTRLTDSQRDALEAYYWRDEADTADHRKKLRFRAIRQLRRMQGRVA